MKAAPPAPAVRELRFIVGRQAFDDPARLQRVREEPRRAPDHPLQHPPHAAYPVQVEDVRQLVHRDQAEPAVEPLEPGVADRGRQQEIDPARGEHGRGPVGDIDIVAQHEIDHAARRPELSREQTIGPLRFARFLLGDRAVRGAEVDPEMLRMEGAPATGRIDLDCGKPVVRSGGVKAAAAVAPAARAPAVPGTREVATPAWAPVKSPVTPGTPFCAVCGAPLAQFLPVRASAPPTTRTNLAITLVLLDEAGNVVQRFDRKTLDTTIGRQDGDVRFPDDPFMSPLHAKLSWEQDRLVVRDLGSRNGTWVFLEEPHRLADGDLLLIGAQVIRFRRLGYPGPHAPDADATRRMGSLTPSADIASLTQLRSDGSARDIAQLSPGRDIRVGRERGEWIFPYDPSMSAEHALVRSEDAAFGVVGAGSRDGIGLAARADIPLQHNSRILVGDKLLRIEISA